MVYYTEQKSKPKKLLDKQILLCYNVGTTNKRKEG